MAAYLGLMQQVEDTDRYRNGYLPGLRPFVRTHGAEVLVAGFDAEPAEMSRRTARSCSAFADAAAAWACSMTPAAGR